MHPLCPHKFRGWLKLFPAAALMIAASGTPSGGVLTQSLFSPSSGIPAPADSGMNVADAPVDWDRGYCTDHVLVRLRPSARRDAQTLADALDSLERIAHVEFGALSVRPLHQVALRVLDDAARSETNELRRTALEIQAAELSDWLVVSIPDGSNVEAMVAAFARSEAVAAVQPDHIGRLHAIVSDVEFPKQWGLFNTGLPMEGVPGVADADISGPEAWWFTSGSPDVIVAVLDTGASQSHPDLAGQFVGATNVVRPGQTWDDSSSLSHGTFCSGIIGALANNGIGVAGMASRCRIMPVKIFQGTWGSESSAAAGLSYITSLKNAGTYRVEVANMSFGFETVGTVFTDAVNAANNAGIVLVASTGNTPGAAIGFPARMSSVIAVGATDNRDAAAPFQTTGPEMDVCAPGVSIFTTTDIGTNPNGYSFQSGTSMAAPFVSATAALMRTVNPSLSPAQIRDAIMISAKDLGAPGTDSNYGAGRLNARDAVHRALLMTGTCDSDWNHDFVHSSDDLFAFLADWFAFQADLNQDGATTADDLFLFLNDWFYGC